ncbi:hypothetical protein ACFV5N_03220 [Streptomyces sp. NPDC059853]|uniref:hypothetical protein n=1 Tax=Streptomyces sp. NPDC059853 TaxID=3346973 RepID=UPI00365BC9EC
MSGPAPREPGPADAVLEVAGGHLTWNVLDPAADPLAVLDDPVAAQGWLWALWGEAAALRAAAGAPPGPAVPALPGLADAARRLAYAHWAARWWPASVLDGIPPLDGRILAGEIAELTEECDPLFGGEEPEPLVTAEPPAPSGYALAAGDAADAGGFVLASGTAGTDWRRCPPGLLDASEEAVSWEITRRPARATVLTLAVVAAPGLTDRTRVPDRLRPRARVTTADGGLAEIPLRLTDDSWTGGAPPPGAGRPEITVHLPAFPEPPTPDDAEQRRLRQRIRALAHARLTGSGPVVAPLRAETEAAEDR